MGARRVSKRPPLLQASGRLRVRSLAELRDMAAGKPVSHIEASKIREGEKGEGAR